MTFGLEMKTEYWDTLPVHYQNIKTQGKPLCFSISSQKAPKAAPQSKEYIPDRYHK